MFCQIFSCPHITPKPDSPGKIVWLSGPPGAGKSTTAKMLAKKCGYAYYEADCTMGMMNPFLKLNADDEFESMLEARPLKVRNTALNGDSRGPYNSNESTG